MTFGLVAPAEYAAVVGQVIGWPGLSA